MTADTSALSVSGQVTVTSGRDRTCEVCWGRKTSIIFARLLTARINSTAVGFGAPKRVARERCGERPELIGMLFSLDYRR